MILLSGVVVLGALSTMRVQSAAWPRFLTTGLHRNLALLTLVFLALHIVTAGVDPFTHLGWLTAVVPFSSYYRTLWRGLGAVAFELLAAIIVSSPPRGRTRPAASRLAHVPSVGTCPVPIELRL